MSETVPPLRRHAETPVEAARRLEQEAKNIASSAVAALMVDLDLVAGRCVDLGTLASLPPGLRDLLPRVGEQIAAALESARAISARSSGQ